MPNDNPVRRFYFSFTMRWGFVGGELGIGTSEDTRMLHYAVRDN